MVAVGFCDLSRDPTATTGDHCRRRSTDRASESSAPERGPAAAPLGRVARTAALPVQPVGPGSVPVIAAGVRAGLSGVLASRLRPGAHGTVPLCTFAA